MHNIPPVELAIRISKILNRNKNQLKEYQDRNGRINFNLLIGLVLGGICSFTDKPAINQILRIFFPIFNDSQLEDYANLMMGLNNHLVYLLDTNPGRGYIPKPQIFLNLSCNHCYYWAVCICRRFNQRYRVDGEHSINLAIARLLIPFLI